MFRRKSERREVAELERRYDRIRVEGSMGFFIN